MTSHPILIIVMGVTATGKSTLGKALADALEMPFIDGDTLHPKANIDKMSAGVPLDDQDRHPWLQKVRERAEEVVHREQFARAAAGVVVACSALKRAYRDVLRGGIQHPNADNDLPTYFVYISGSEQEIRARMEKRQGHFMKIGMLESQLKTLESPDGEDGVVVVPLETSTAEQVRIAREKLRSIISKSSSLS